MIQNNFDLDEREVLDAYETGDFKSDLSEERKTHLAQMAKLNNRKDEHINIRIARRDLKALQERAIEEGLSQQSLVTSILHKYFSGRLEDVTRGSSKNY